MFKVFSLSLDIESTLIPNRFISLSHSDKNLFTQPDVCSEGSRDGLAGIHISEEEIVLIVLLKLLIYVFVILSHYNSNLAFEETS